MNFLAQSKFWLALSIIFFISGLFFYADGAIRRVGVNNFRVEIEGEGLGGFKEISGLESETEVIEETGATPEPGATRYISGRGEPGTAILCLSGALLMIRRFMNGIKK